MYYPSFRVSPNCNLPVKDLQLEIYLSQSKEELMNIKKDGQSYPNLSKDEQQALKSLAKDNSMVIKPAGKGRGIFI